jgi:hypothetical protein
MSDQGQTHFDRHSRDEPQGEHPTQPFWHASPPGQVPVGHYRGRTRHWVPRHWMLGAVTCVLAVGGIIGGLALTGGAPDTAAITRAGGQPAGGQAAPGSAGQAAPGSAGQAALLDDTLAGASSSGPLAVTSSAATAAAPLPGAPAPGRVAAACAKARAFARAARRSGFRRLARVNRVAARRCRFARRHIARRRVFRFFLLRGVDGQFTIRTAHGVKTLAFERGVIESVSGGTVVIKTVIGTPVSWAWHLTASTVVRDRAGKLSRGSLAAGEPVWAGGPVVSGTKDARLIVIRPPGR